MKYLFNLAYYVSYRGKKRITNVSYSKQIVLPFMPTEGMTLSFDDSTLDDDTNLIVLRVHTVIYSVTTNNHLIVLGDEEQENYVSEDFSEEQLYHKTLLSHNFKIDY